MKGLQKSQEFLKACKNCSFPRTSLIFFCLYGNNIYDLYRKIHADEDVDFLQVLYDNAHDKEFWEYRKNIDEIYLFFDYDGHDHCASDEQINEMLEFFNNENENGKLYINYPMVESLFYTKELVDPDFDNYSISINQLKTFKNICNNFGYYKSYDFCLLPSNFVSKENKQQERLICQCKENWEKLKIQNVQKANWLNTGALKVELDKISKPLNQKEIFCKQENGYINPKNEISILNAFPQFLFDYFKD